MQFDTQRIMRARPFHSSYFATIVGGFLLFVGCKHDPAPEPSEASAAEAPSGSPASAPRPSVAPNALALPLASVTSVLNPNGLPVYTGATGSVEGTITIEGPPPPSPLRRRFFKVPRR